MVARAKAARSRRAAPAVVFGRQKEFCLELINLARQASVPWDIRRLATLMAEQQLRNLEDADAESFDAIFVALNLKQPGLDQPLSPAVLKEGYTRVELREFTSSAGSRGTIACIAECTRER